MHFLYILTAVAVVASFIADQQKTKKAIKVGSKKLWNITPPFITILVGVAIALYLVPQEMIVAHLGGSHSYFGVSLAAVIGSITMMPGPIVYPLCRILVDQGVSYSVIAAFSTTLMMVGILTYPVEKAYFGKKLALTRNVISFVVALLIAGVFSLAGGLLS